MNIEFSFVEDYSSGLHKYEFAPRGQLSLPYTFMDNHKIVNEWKDINRNPLYERYNIGNFGSFEYFGIYMALSWTLCADKYVFAITPYETEYTSKIIDEPFELIKWEYIVEHEDTVIEKGYIKLDRGFEKARSPTGYKVPSDKAGLFFITNRSKFFDLPKSGLFDSFSLVNIFVLGEDRKHELVTFLNQRSRPLLAKFLTKADLFISLKFGFDPGEFDCLSIYSLEPIASKLKNLTDQYAQSSQQYMAAIKSLKGYNGLEELVERLLWPNHKTGV
ncbi:hypothetical protein V6Z05_19770 [Leptospira venezuelensis]|uniref:hypothetical protein n=1 Tax=Leptospira venezuelensis TaxID=1958811 RepID=UPI000A39FF0A|nr:hypothetical protein [Leptospira venezuelensis]